MIVAAFREYSKLEIEYEYSKTLFFQKPCSQQAQIAAFLPWAGGGGEQVSKRNC